MLVGICFLPLHHIIDSILNYTPCMYVGKKTLEKMFLGERTEVCHLKIFGCHVYIHIPKEKRSRLDPSGKKGLFVGYSEKPKDYRIYILDTIKLN